MRLIKPRYEILHFTPDALQLMERAGRTCYKSEERITEDSAGRFVDMICRRGHETVLEHASMTVRFICDRGVSHSLVRHRHASPSQESTIYCNYKSGVTFIIPPWVCDLITEGDYTERAPQYCEDWPEADLVWYQAMLDAEWAYLELLKKGWRPAQARNVLPVSVKTELVVTANFREWKHILKLRCGSDDHPQMNELMLKLREAVRMMYPMIFDRG